MRVAERKFVHVATQILPADAVVRPVQRAFHLAPEYRPGCRVQLETAERTGVAAAACDLVEGIGLAALTFSTIRTAIPEYKFETGIVTWKVALKLFEVISHFLTFAFFRRAMTPSCATANGSVLACSHSHSVRAGTSNSVAASACVSPRRLRSDLMRLANCIGTSDSPPRALGLAIGERRQLRGLRIRHNAQLQLNRHARNDSGIEQLGEPVLGRHIAAMFFLNDGVASGYFNDSVCFIHVFRFSDPANEVNNYFAESANSYNTLIINENP
jgi:hypothetical protein